jgi:hypothetical protein
LDFLSVLALNGCDGLFGIDTIAKSAWAEMKVGDASVVVPINDGDSHDQGKFVPVAFAFDEEKPKFRVHGKCGKNHKHTSKPVKKHMSTPPTFEPPGVVANIHCSVPL